jgi:hypothetical protein
MLLSWRGYGFLGILSIFIAVGFMCLGMLVNEDAGMLAFSAGWVVAGILCYVVGDRANRPHRDDPAHLFCNVKLETFGLIYIGVGVFLGMISVTTFLQNQRLKKPLRPATRTVRLVHHQTS